MCKETTQALACPYCGRRMYYAEQHLLVCDYKQHKMSKVEKIQRKRKQKKEARNVA